MRFGPHGLQVISGLTGVTKVACGNKHVCAITDRRIDPLLDASQVDAVTPRRERVHPVALDKTVG